MRVSLADFFPGERIALLEAVPEQRLQRGQVGTIRERAAPGLYRVEFADTGGSAYASLLLHASQMLLLRWQPGEQSA